MLRKARLDSPGTLHHGRKVAVFNNVPLVSNIIYTDGTLNYVIFKF